MSAKKTKDNIHIVLVKSRHVGNIGSSARAMNNMGFLKLALVDPAPYDVPETYMKGWNSEEIIKKAFVFSDLKECLKKYSLVVGMTRRKGKSRENVFAFEDVMDEVISVAQKNKVAFLFGTESKGLLNSELKECNKLCFLNTYGTFPSLNLSQAVLVVCYELHKKTQKKLPRASLKLAKKEHIDFMYEHIDRILNLLGYNIKGNRPLRKQILKRVKAILSRALLEKKDVQMIRGLCQQIEKREK